MPCHTTSDIADIIVVQEKTLKFCRGGNFKHFQGSICVWTGEAGNIRVSQMDRQKCAGNYRNEGFKKCL